MAGRLQRHQALKKLNSALGALSFDSPRGMERILECFLFPGFGSVRFYEFSYSLAANDKVLVLSSSAERKYDHKLGYQVNYKHSTVYRGQGGSSPVLGASGDSGLTDGERRWISDLGLEGQAWIDLPLLVDDQEVGLIACAFDESKVALEEDDLELLELLASRVAAKIYLAPGKATVQARERINAFLQRSDDLNDLIDHASEHARSLLHASLVAVFEYNWQTDSLLKIAEHCDPSIQAKMHDFPEVYNAAPPSLTRQAWHEDRLRHIVDFADFAKTHPQFIAGKAQDRHATMLGEIRTLIYSRVGTTEPRYLIRLINRADDPRLPFFAGHRQILDSLCDCLAEAVERFETNRRLGSLQRISTGIVRHIDRPDEGIRLLRATLASEGLDHFGVLAHHEGSSNFVFDYFYGALFTEWKLTGAFRRWKTDQFYTRRLETVSSPVVDIRREPEYKRSGHLLDYFRRKKVSHVLVLPFRAATTCGVLLYPLAPNEQVPRHPSVPAGLAGSLSTYAALLGAYVEAQQSQMTAQKAREVVGHIGHEVNTPASELGQQAVAGLYEAMAQIPPDNLQVRNELNHRINDLKSALLAVGRTMDIAMMVAKGNNGRLSLNFRMASLSGVLKEARDALRDELVVENQQGGQSRYNIELGPSCDRLEDVVCDPGMLKAVMMNLFRNGMKYSLPRFPPRPMVVNVVGMNQIGMRIVRVTNWGLGIPEEEHELIFNAFVRGSVHDTRRAIRGMGLGLYISRQIVLAHNGELFCAESKGTLSDPARIAAWEGFETTFEMRIPDDLVPGVREHGGDA
jgi:signal transduction histidine kinase